MANHSLKLIVPVVSGDKRQIRDHADHDTYLEIEIHLYR